MAEVTNYTYQSVPGQPVLLHAAGPGRWHVQLEAPLLEDLGDAAVVSLQLQLELVQLLVLQNGDMKTTSRSQ